MFHQAGILNSFEAKIRVGYYMGIYGHVHKNNLDCIKAIRNAFAHAATPLSFETPEVKAACDLMKQPKPIHPHAINAKTGKPEFEIVGGESARDRYIKICSRVAHNLFWIGTTISPGILTDPADPTVPVKARPVPLP